MCLEDKDLSDKEADCCRREVGKNFGIVTELLADIMVKLHINSTIASHERRISKR